MMTHVDAIYLTITRAIPMSTDVCDTCSDSYGVTHMIFRTRAQVGEGWKP